MKTGPNWFTTTSTAGTSGIPATNQGGGMVGPQVIPGYTTTNNPTPTYIFNGVTTTLTSIPIYARGAYNKTFQMVATQTQSNLAQVNIDVSIDPQVLSNPATATWFVAGVLSTTLTMVLHSGNVLAFRARMVGVSNSDSIGVVYMFDDAG